MADKFQIESIGSVMRHNNAVTVAIHERYKDGLLGLDRYSHIKVYYWFHQNDSEEKRKVLQVHPRGNKEKPLRGVFATRSPQRPNLIGMCLCRILSIAGTRIHVEKIDAFHGSPVIDIKPYMPELDSLSD